MLPDLPFLAEVMGRLLPGLPLTLLLAALSVAAGAALALLLSLLRASSRAPTSSCCAGRRCWCSFS